MSATLGVIAVLILLNALFVAAEFASVSSRHTRIRQAAEEGSRAARWVLGVVQDSSRLDRYIAGCQVGITLASLLLGALGQAAVTPRLAGGLHSLGGMSEGTALGVATTGTLLLLTVGQMLIGELVPKSLALQFPTQTAIYTSGPMRVSLGFFRPLISLLNGSGVTVLRLLGVSTGGHRHIHSPQEISFLIAESRVGGLLSAEEQDRLDRALRLAVLPVRRLMVPRRDIVGVDGDATLIEVQRVLVASAFTRVPVFEGTVDRIVGVLRAKEVASHIASGEGGKVARVVMRPIAHVPESIRAERLVAELRRQHSEQAVVVDEHGGVSGLVTLEDLLVEVLCVAEAPQPGEVVPQRLPDGRVRLPGRMRVDEAHDWLGVLWEGESDTLSGIIAERLGHIAEVGERAVIDGVAVEVESVEHLAVRALLATPAQFLSDDEPVDEERR